MKVYAVWVPSRKAFVGTKYYISGTPTIYQIKGAAQNKARAYTKYHREECFVKTFELVEKEE